MNINFNMKEIFDMPVKIMITIISVTGILLFIPESYLRMLHLDAIEKSLTPLIGIIFLFVTILLIVTLLLKCLPLLSKKL